MTKYVLYLVKPNKETAWQAWLKRLDTEYRNEVEKILDAEGVYNESYINFQIGDSLYCLALESQSDHVTYDSSLLSVEHDLQKKECLSLVSKGRGIQFMAEAI